jgi:hypothetical protein
MELLTKLEQQVLKWAKGVPHLPTPARKWLGDNVWWIALVGAILTGIGILFAFVGLIGVISVLGTPAASYFATTTFTSWAIVTGVVGLVFLVIEGLLLATAITPLKEKQKKGWVLLFVLWLVGAVSVVVNAILSLNPFGFVLGLLFGAIWLAITGYFLFEIHGQFAHVERSKGVKHAKKS